jgi:hypothetical protein
MGSQNKIMLKIMGTLFSKQCFYEANLRVMITFQLSWPNLKERASNSPTHAHAHKNLTLSNHRNLISPTRWCVHRLVIHKTVLICERLL